MTTLNGYTFTNEEVWLENTHYNNCSFVNVSVKTTQGSTFTQCTFVNCRFDESVVIARATNCSFINGKPPIEREIVTGGTYTEGPVNITSTVTGGVSIIGGNFSGNINHVDNRGKTE